jgi:hypothetical protein
LGAALHAVDKTGVYRAKDGTGIYLNEGDAVAQHVWDQVTYDEEGTKAYTAPAAETDLFSYVQAPAKPEERKEQPVENRMEPPVANRSDAELAADAAKGPKKP